MRSSLIHITLVLLGFSILELANASPGALLYPRQSAPCSDSTSVPCQGTLCCVPGATCFINSAGNPECGTYVPPAMCGTGTVQCTGGFTHCCPTGQTCLQDTNGNNQCNGRFTGPVAPRTPQAQCNSGGAKFCTGDNTFTICCSSEEYCGHDATNTAYCRRTPQTGVEPATPPNTPTPNTPTPNTPTPNPTPDPTPNPTPDPTPNPTPDPTPNPTPDPNSNPNPNTNPGTPTPTPGGSTVTVTPGAGGGGGGGTTVTVRGNGSNRVKAAAAGGAAGAAAVVVVVVGVVTFLLG